MGGWLYSDYNASLSSNWTELDWTGTELGNSLSVNSLITKIRLNSSLQSLIRIYAELSNAAFLGD